MYGRRGIEAAPAHGWAARPVTSSKEGSSLAAIAAIAAAAVALAAPAHADRDTDFADQLHTYGIYGPRDYNAWLAKIICERLPAGVDAYESAHFVSTNLPRGTTQVQTWQFLGTALSYYCPDQAPVLQR